ncbi:excalibur calcium-binding domain-containing protein [Streptomyces lavendulocolor]|uniref:Excalibur calcium-binding domain-containing protein n=1 Tax=Streptomyces lavendulocolor TaxID=67316 RepID=A0ABV2W3M9_9ACTN
MSNAYQQPPAARPLYRMKRVWAGGLLLLMIGTGCGALGSEDSSKPTTKAAPAPAATVTTTATATVTATPSAAPAPTVTATRTVTATATVTRQAPAAADDSSDAAADTDTDSGSVYYANCTAARAAGAAPVHRGEPGYASHLDRDNDGVGCDNG